MDFFFEFCTQNINSIQKMKQITKWIFAVFVMLTASTAFSQGKISGTVVDAELNTPLSGVNVVVKGTSTGVSTDAEGKFSIKANSSNGELILTYIGYDKKTVKFTSLSDLGTLKLNAASNQLEEVIVKSTVIDVAKDRKTPVAVSTIKSAEIVQKLGNQEFPEILKNTPSVYASKSGGGFGDSRVTIRGFSQENIAVMINGVPVNDMENSRVFWSNWAGLSDVTSAMQVQRGLGSSKLAISSVGGTINVVTKTSEMKKGGSVFVGTANNDYLKTQASYSTGKLDNGLSASILLNQTRGDGYVYGTKFEGANYFVALGYEINDKNDLQFTFTGAPQWHNQRGSAITIAEYIKYGSNGEPNVRYNADWGMLNGEEYNFRTNYYHKPVMSLNWDYKISDKTKISSVLYGSWGRGGGTNGVGRIRGLAYNAAGFRKADGTIDVEKIYAFNSGETVNIAGLTPTSSTRSLTGGLYLNSTATANNLANGISKVSSINSHNWYGGVANINTKLNENITVDFGVDLRTYKGIHYQNVSDILGASAFLDNTTVSGGVATNGNINNPNQTYFQVYESTPHFNPFFNVDHQQKVSYNNDGNVNWLGAFTQVEYSKNNLTAFVQAAVSQQGFKRVDYFKYLSTDPLSSTDYEKILGGNIKGGVNYNINKNHNVFVNAGYYSKQPFFNAVYPNNASKVNGNLVNEKVTGFEAGYGFRNSRLNINFNLYNTTWKDRYQRSNDVATDNPGGYYDFSGITEIHSGVEVDFNYKATEKFKINGMFSLGNWDYKGNSTSNRYDVLNNPIAGGTATTLYLDKVKVGNSAQLTASLGGSYEVVKRVIFDASYLFVDKLYANISPASFSTETNKGSLLLPSYGLLDAGFSYKMLVGKDKADSVNFRLNVNNVLDKTYIAESSTNNHAQTRDDFASDAAYQTYADANLYNGILKTNTVYFGFGRTWNFGITYNF